MPEDAEDSPAKRHQQPFMRGERFIFGRESEPDPLIAREIEAIETNRHARCPLCGEPNGIERASCKRCNYRLPWAAKLEGLPENAPRENRIDRALQPHIASVANIRCRYCNRRIEAYTRQCPHCDQWLVAAYHEFELDPWQPDYDPHATKNADIAPIAPRAGCLNRTLMILLILALQVLAHRKF